MYKGENVKSSIERKTEQDYHVTVPGLSHWPAGALQIVGNNGEKFIAINYLERITIREDNQAGLAISYFWCVLTLLCNYW